MGRFTAVLTVAGVALGCGRVSFDARGDADGAGDARRGGGGPDVPDVPFCASLTQSPTFCSDFRNGSAGWDNDQQINGSYVIDATGGPTPSNGALIVTTNVGTAPAEASLLIGHTPPTTSLSFSFDVRIDVPGNGFPALGLVVFDGPSVSHGLEYVHQSASTVSNLEEIVIPDSQPATFTNHDVPKFLPFEWHRISVDVSVGTTWSATVQLDGAQATIVTLDDNTNGTVAFSVGIPYLGDTSSQWVIRVSNVVLDVQ